MVCFQQQMCSRWNPSLKVRLAAHLHCSLCFMALTLPPLLYFHQSGPWHHPGESHMNRHTCGRGDRCICISVCVCVRAHTCLSLPVFPGVVTDFTDYWARHHCGGGEKNETPQHCRPLIKSLKYSSNLHKNLSAKQPWIYFSSSPVWRIIFFFVAQALQLLAVCISNTNSSCSKDSSNISQRNSHGCLFRPWIQVVGLCYELQFRRKCLSIVYVCVKTKCGNVEFFVTTVAISPVARKWSLWYFPCTWSMFVLKSECRSLFWFQG